MIEGTTGFDITTSDGYTTLQDGIESAQSSAETAISAASIAQNAADAAMPKSGGTFTGTIGTRQVNPSQNNTYTIGNSDLRFRDIYSFTTHLDSLLAFDNANTSWKNIQAYTTVAFRNRGNTGSAIGIDASNVPASSSIRYKENIKDSTDEDGLQILKLRPVTFDWKQGSGFENKGANKSFIAEEAYEVDDRYVYSVAKIITPEINHIDEETGEIVVDKPAEYVMQIEGLNEQPIISDIVKLCQIQQDKINELESKIDLISDVLVKNKILNKEEINNI